jgi:hypothetical protein
MQLEADRIDLSARLTNPQKWLILFVDIVILIIAKII